MIPRILRTKIISCHRQDGQTCGQEIYWSLLKADIKAYINGCDVCMRAKSTRHKTYGNLQSMPIPTHAWKNLSMDFVTGLAMSKDWKGTSYDSILVIVDRLTKIVHYEAVNHLGPSQKSQTPTTDKFQFLLKPMSEELVSEFARRTATTVDTKSLGKDTVARLLVFDSMANTVKPAKLH